jgi:cation transport ATPase
LIAAGASVSAGPRTIEVTAETVFGSANQALARRFARCILAFEEVRSLAIDPANATATVNYRLPHGDPGAFLTRLADAVAAPFENVGETELPEWSCGQPVTLYRHSSVISIFEHVTTAPGWLSIRDPAIEHNKPAAQRLSSALHMLPGVTGVAVNGKLLVCFDPRAVAVEQLIRAAEAEVFGGAHVQPIAVAEPVDFRLENLTLGVAAVGEFVLPLMAPIASGLLVFAALGTFGTAAAQLCERKIGLPLLYSCAVGSRLGSGQFLAAALLSWFFRYWEYRYRQDIEGENETLLEETASLPKEVRILTADGIARIVSSRDITTGQHIRAVAGEIVPADGIVRSGAALLDETAFNGTSAPRRKSAGHEVCAGSKVLVGEIDIEASRIGRNTRAARIAQALIRTTVPPPHAQELNQEAEAFAGRTVAPTLLTAGAGLAMGNLTTAAAILSLDYATGVGLAMPLASVRDCRLAIRNGAVLRVANALARLATTSWIVLDEHESLWHAQYDVAEVRSSRADDVRLLPAIAAAGVWLGDERGPAIARVCQARGLVVRRAEAREISREGVAVRLGGHMVRLRGRPVVAGTTPPPLSVEVDGVEVAGVRFAPNGRLEAAETVRRLRQRGLRVALMSDRAAASLANALGVDRYGGNMSGGDQLRFLRDLQQERSMAAYVGDGSMAVPVAREAQLWIGFAGADASGLGLAGEPDISLLTPSIAALPALFALADDGVKRKRRVQYAVMAPNLFSVAGAFAFGFTPMAGVLLSNLGTSLIYSAAKRALHMTAVSRPDIAWCTDDEAGALPPVGPHVERAEIGRRA